MRNADFGQRLSETEEIAAAIVNNCDHSRTLIPLAVTSPFKRAMGQTS